MKCPKCGFNNIEGIMSCSQCGTALVSSADSPGSLTRDARLETEFKFKLGDVFGERYRILEEVGRGGMGSVYTAEDLELNIVVALKIIHPEFTRSARFIQQFKKEILLAREITHENVVRIHDFGDVEGIKFISMQYVEGESLDDLILKSGPLDIQRSLQICRQICQGLQAAHRKGIVHLDLKPHNILIDKDEHIYIADFGLAKSLEGGRARLTSKILATPEYISPEQARGQDVDQRTDIYALGCIMYEMMTGKPLFTSETVLGYIQKHLHEVPSMPSRSNRHISTYLDKLILKCLEKRPQRRYQSVTEILSDLDEERAKAGPFFWIIRIRKYLSIAFWTAVIVLLGIFIYKYFTEKGDIKKRSMAVLYFENLTKEQSLDQWERNLAILLTADLDQSIYFRVLSENRLREILTAGNHPGDDMYSPEVLKEVASGGNVNFLLKGRFSKAGDNFRVIVEAIDPARNQSLFSVDEDGKGVESFHAIVDRLTPQIKRNFDLSWEEIRADNDKEVGKITTDSTEALQHYATGMSYYNDGKYEESIEALKMAVEIDPEFALAHYYIALNYSYIGDNSEIYRYTDRALELKERVSKKEFYMIQGFEYSTVKRDRKRAIEVYQELLKEYPDDEEGHLFLGAKYRGLEEWENALACFQNVLKINKHRKTAYDNLINLYMRLGRYDEALESVGSAEEAFGLQPFIHFYKSRIYLLQEKYDLARSEAQQAVKKDPDNTRNRINMGNICQATGVYPEAEEIYRRLTETDRLFAVSKGYHWLTCLRLEQGQLEQSRRSIQDGIEYSREKESKEFETEFEMLATQVNLQIGQPQEALSAARRALKLIEEMDELVFLKMNALCNLGQVYLQLGEVGKAEAVVSQLENLPEPFYGKRPLRNIYFLKGLIAGRRNDFDEAVELLKEVNDSLLPRQSFDEDRHAQYLDALASTYYEMGDTESAIKTYKEIGSLTFGRLLFGGIYVKSFYWLGKCYQKKTWNGKAIESYDRFIGLWNKTDSAISELRDARTQLSKLRD
jgi:serine/threonine protein kinase/Tfp pilus assembly protein PilF